MTHIRGSVHLRRRLAGCGLATVVGLAAAWLSLAGGAGLAHAAPAADVTPGQSIQLALNGAANGDTLRIHAGVYTESLTLNKPVSLTAFGDGLVTLVALAGQRVLTITGAAVTSATVVSELTFTGGHVTGSGGGILVSSGAQPRLLNLIITSNTASVNGGGIAAQTPSSLVLVNARVTSNTATSSGGGAWTNSGATLSGGSFQHNTAVTGSGGGLMVFGGGLALTGTEFFSNTTLVGDGGGLYHFGGASAHLEQASLTANFSAHSGGAAYFEGPLTVDDADVFNNTATVDGGGLYVLGPALVSGGLFLDNQATITSSRGGGLAALSSLTITGTQFVNNSAQRPSGVPRGGQGGGVYAAGLLAVTGAQFSGNSAGDGGGGVRGAAGVVISGSHFESNGCRDNFCTGAGLWVTGSVLLTATQFLTNRSAFNGAGLFATGPVTVTGGTFQANACTNICFGGGLFTSSSLFLSDTVFVNNHSRSSGAGATAQGQMTVIGGRFEGNVCFNLVSTPYCQGGGLYAVQGLEVTGTLFIRNTADFGGGLYLLNGTGRVVNALFAGNTATQEGSALDLQAFGPATLLHVTITTPTLAAGAAVWVNHSAVSITDTIIASYTVAISVSAGAATGDYNLFFGQAAIAAGAVTTGTHSFVDDPRFRDPGADDYHLSPTSPAVDQGVAAGVETDFEGDPRPLGANVDIGYDEERLFRRVYLPAIAR